MLTEPVGTSKRIHCEPNHDRFEIGLIKMNIATPKKSEFKEDAIIKRIQSYESYKLTRISQPVLSLLNKAAEYLAPSHRDYYLPLLKIVECYLCITQETWDAEKENIINFDKIYEELIGAICSSKFLLASDMSRYGMIIGWNALVTSAYHLGFTALQVIHQPSSKGIANTIYPLVYAFERKILDANEVFLWRGSQIKRQCGRMRWVNIRPIGVRYGQEFAEYLHTACKNYIFAKDGRLVEINIFLTYLENLPPHYSIDSFQNPVVMEVIWKNFKIDFVTNKLNESLFRNTTKGWDSFISFALLHLDDKKFFGKADWNLRKLPRMNANELNPKYTINSKGEVINKKLLIDVPLEVTEEEALKIIFQDIDSSLKKISEWAERSVALIWKNQLRRVASVNKSETHFPIIYNSSNFSEKNYVTMASKIEKYGFTPSISKNTNVARPLGTAAFDLGIPGTSALLPHMALLVIAHPQLTSSFFDKFELYDKFGQINGLFNTDSGSVIQGFKLRRGPRLAHQVIHLTSASEIIINQVITLTTPLRNYLKSQGDDNWRKLFLSSGAGFGHPKSIKSSGLTSDSNNLKKLKDEFIAMGLVSSAEADKFVSRFSLTSLRATVAVHEYIKNPDVAMMARILGHDKYIPELLARYIPKPLLNFFQQRWIRLFQCAIIATAMEGSDYILLATGFKTMQELHEFLKNHALKLHPRKTTVSASSKNSIPHPEEKVVFNVSEESLTVLVSLTLAVKESQESVTELAKYWATYGERLIAYIDDCDDSRADLKDYLSRSRIRASPALVKGLIHA